MYFSSQNPKSGQYSTLVPKILRERGFHLENPVLPPTPGLIRSMSS